MSLAHKRTFFFGAILPFCILIASFIIDFLHFRTSFTLFFSFSLVLHGHVSLLMRCRGEWNNTIKRWWKRPEYFPPNLVSTAHSSQKASCLFLFSWQIIQSERGQAACDALLLVASSRLPKYGRLIADRWPTDYVADYFITSVTSPVYERSFQKCKSPKENDTNRGTWLKIKQTGDMMMFYHCYAIF